MKIANRHIVLASWLVAWTMAVSPVSAADAAAPPAVAPTQASMAMASAAAPSPTVSMPKATSIAATSSPEIKIPDLTKAMPMGKKDAKMDSPPTDVKVPDSVKDVIKKLSTKTEDVTLDDLNSAREAIAKLDALIDIEKRLADLEKIRNERQKASEKKLIDALPKTALMPPPAYTPPPVEKMADAGKTAPPVKMAPPPPPPPPKAPGADVEIIRIEGSNNRYGALVKDSGAVRLVHSGDHLSDGSVVLSVNTQGVQFTRDNSTRLAQVKDVQAVFGDSP